MPKYPNKNNPIACLRARTGMSANDFADLAGIGRAYLKQLECGRRPMSDEHLLGACVAYIKFSKARLDSRSTMLSELLGKEPHA